MNAMRLAVASTFLLAAAGAAEPVRVLVWASGPIREYQFMRALLERESEAKRAEVTVCIQPAPGKAEPKMAVKKDGAFQALTRFPNKFGAGGKEADPFDLDSHDVVVAFDPDWALLDADQVKALARWVRSGGGGLILVAGTHNTRRLARDDKELAAIRDLLPVTLGDSKEEDRDTSKPWKLSFPKAEARPAYLKLDPDGKGPLAGWDEFFGGGRGFYQAYPVKKVRDGAVVQAAFTDPLAEMAGGSARPFLASRNAGRGRVLYLGSPELWRLREYKAAAHDRIWKGLIAAAAAR